MVLQPIVYECPRCSAQFGSVQARRDHFFTAHPYRKPELLLRGQLLGNSETVIHVDRVPGSGVTERPMNASMRSSIDHLKVTGLTYGSTRPTLKFARPRRRRRAT